MKNKGFTLVELLVVIAIIAMLLAILMPALGKVRALAYRVVCSTNLKGIGSGIMIYANDYEESYPAQGQKGLTTEWVSGTNCDATGTASIKWNKKNKWGSSTATPPSSGTVKATISSSLFLLVKYADVGVASFVCKASDQKKFETDNNINHLKLGTNVNEDAQIITDCWDFGGWNSTINGPYEYISYSYQHPYGKYPANPSSSPGKPLMADRNPWLDNDATPSSGIVTNNTDTKGFRADVPGRTPTPTKEQIDNGNAAAHGREGQNVLYNDGHVEFEKVSYCGIEQDNIYTKWVADGAPLPSPITDTIRMEGVLAKFTLSATATNDSSTEEDSVLVNDFSTAWPRATGQQ